MIVVIAGSRTICRRSVLDRAMRNAAKQGIIPTLILSGKASGVDTLGEQWAEDNDVPVEAHPARWGDLNAPNAIPRRGQNGMYNSLAGHDRNVKMGERADAGIIVWDGVSRGTKDMIAILRRLKKPFHVERVSVSAGDVMLDETRQPGEQQELFGCNDGVPDA